MQAKYPGYYVVVRDVDLTREKGETDLLKVGSVIDRELVVAAGLAGIAIGSGRRSESTSRLRTRRRQHEHQPPTDAPGSSRSTDAGNRDYLAAKPHSLSGSRALPASPSVKCEASGGLDAPHVAVCSVFHVCQAWAAWSPAPPSRPARAPPWPVGGAAAPLPRCGAAVWLVSTAFWIASIACLATFSVNSRRSVPPG